MTKLRRVLVIEDDVFISELYVRALKKNGYEVMLARTGTEGLAEAKKEKYDLMLLDIMVPEITGMEILEEVRGAEKQIAPDMKIFVTTNLDQDDETRARVEGMADGYIIKADITPRSVLQMIQRYEEQSH